MTGSRLHLGRQARRGVAVIALIALAAAVAALLGRPGDAEAEVRYEGEWPDEPKVSLTVSGEMRAEAIRKLADEAGWSVVAQDLEGGPLHIQIQDQAPSKVLDLLLSDADYVAKRDGTLISIAKQKQAPQGARQMVKAIALQHAQAAREHAAKLRGAAHKWKHEHGAPGPPHAAPPAAKLPPPPALGSSHTKKGQNRVVTGGNLHLKKGEVVHDLVVLGGSVKIEGTVTGDMVVIGGSARVLEGAHVMGDASALGGSLRVEDGARVDGDVGVLGGSLRRGDNAAIHGDIVDRFHEDFEIDVKDEDAEDRDAHADESEEEWSVGGLFAGIGDAMTSTAVLWVLGAILLALATRRMQALETEVVGRPFRSLALGLVALLGAIVGVVALCVTLIGIPIALLAIAGAVLAGYIGFCAVLLTAGNVLVRHRTENPYVHLAVGCVVYLILAAIPGFGDFVTAAVVLTGLGALVATRGAGLVPPRRGPARKEWTEQAAEAG